MSQAPSSTPNPAPSQAGRNSAPGSAQAAAPTPIITLRRLSPGDSIAELTRLLHRAYAKQVEMGLRPLAGRQDEKTTMKRVFAGECYVAVQHTSLPDPHDLSGNGLAVATRQKLVGSILFHEVEESEGPPWFRQPHVDSFSQFAVDPDMQGLGIGLMLLDRAENRAVECGSTEMGLSMAEPDTGLMNFYLKRGYRFIEHWQWPYTNYRSAILSKTLGK